MLRIKQSQLPVTYRQPLGQAPIIDTPSGSLGFLVMLRPIVPVQLSAHDPGQLAFTFRRINGTLPPGLSLDPSTGRITGSPGPVIDDLTWQFEIEVRNSIGLVSSRAYSLTVTRNGYQSPQPPGYQPPSSPSNSQSSGPYII